MRRSSKLHRSRKADDTDDSAMNDSVTDNGNEVELSFTKKRTSRGYAKESEDKDGNQKQGSRKSLTKRKKKDENDSVDSEEEAEKPMDKKKKGNNESLDESEKDNGKSPSKSKKRGRPSKKGTDEEYEVEKIVDQRTIKGRRQFLIRWKGYSEDVDSWEQESNLNCDRLIEEFLAEQEEDEKAEKEAKEKAKPGSAKKAKNKKPARRSIK